VEPKELDKIKHNQPILFNNLLNKIIKVGDASSTILLEILNDPTTPNEIKLSISGNLLKQVMDFLTANNGNKNDGTK
jgi:hypothetical protein